ncbi:hypothetical protein J4422_01990 [Candidatus Pacearchaeota archaeon]|nr:hypothetical protein [Candidatus Pacearchaeota archaeon]
MTQKSYRELEFNPHLMPKVLAYLSGLGMNERYTFFGTHVYYTETRGKKVEKITIRGCKVTLLDTNLEVIGNLEGMIQEHKEYVQMVGTK